MSPLVLTFFVFSNPEPGVKPLHQPDESSGPSERAARPLSIVMPAFNEGAVIETVIAELASGVLDRFEGDIDLIVVDDASLDNTADILDQLKGTIPALKVHRNPSNRGHGPSLITAIDRSDSEWIFHLDSDRQFVPEEFWNLWERREHADLILGFRQERHDPAARLLISRVTSRMVTRLAGRPVRDANCPFKLFRRTTWDELRPLMGPSPFAPSIMLSLGAARLSSIEEVPVTHRPREHGPSTLVGFRLARSIARAAFQTLQFSNRLRRVERSRHS